MSRYSVPQESAQVDERDAEISRLRASLEEAEKGLLDLQLKVPEVVHRAVVAERKLEEAERVIDVVRDRVLKDETLLWTPSIRELCEAMVELARRTPDNQKEPRT